MVALGYPVGKPEANAVLKYLNLDMLKYLMEEKNVKPSKKTTRFIISDSNDILKTDKKFIQFRDYLLQKIEYWPRDSVGIDLAIEKDRSDILDLIENQSPGSITGGSRYVYTSRLNKIRNSPRVRAWFNRHPYKEYKFFTKIVKNLLFQKSRN